MNKKEIPIAPRWAQKVVNSLVKSQQWLINNRVSAAQLLSQDGKGYLPGRPVITRAIRVRSPNVQAHLGTNAIRHPKWNAERIGFQPYPYESATREILKMLKNTKVEGDAAFLQTLDEEQVVKELFDYELVKKAADKVGGLHLFSRSGCDEPLYSYGSH